MNDRAKCMSMVGHLVLFTEEKTDIFHPLCCLRNMSSILLIAEMFTER